MPVLANVTQQAAIVFDIARSCSLIIFASGVRWFHSGGIFAALSPTTAAVIVEAAQAAKAAGAEYVDSAGVVDGQMVSARAWPDNPAWMREFIEVLRAKAPVTA